MKKLTDLERKKLLHEAVWGDLKPFKENGTLSECNYINVPMYEEEIENFRKKIKNNQIKFGNFL